MGANRRQLIGGAAAALAVGAAVTTDRDVVYAGVDDDINEIVGQQNKIYKENQPIHLYDYSAPRDVILQLYDALVPRMMDTWTVFYVPGVGAVDMTPSKGYPIPYGVQLTSPEYAKRLGHYDDGSVALPQPEPTGLYTNGITTDASWVLAVNEDGYILPEYHEETCVCYPFKVEIDPQTRTVKRVGQATSSVTIDLSRAQH